MLNEHDLNRDMITLRIIFFALLFSLAVYLFIGLAVVKNPRGTMADDALGMLRMALYGTSAVILFIVKPVRKFIITRGLQGSQRAGGFKHPELQKYLQAMIVAAAMTEAIGIFGLVLFILGKNSLDLYALIVISAFAMLQFRPKRDDVIGFIEGNRMGPFSAL